MNPRNQGLALALVCPLLCLLARPASGANCTTETLQIQPQWLSTLAFNPATDELLIADPKAELLLVYDSRTGEIARRPVKSLASLTRIDGGFLVETDGAPKVIRERNTMRLHAAAATARPDETFSLYANWATTGSTFAGFGSLGGVDAARPPDPRVPQRGFKLGFLRGKVTADSPSFRAVELLYETERNDFYLLGFPYFAATDDGLFVVRMDEEEACISRVAQSGKPGLPRLKAFPEGFRTIPPVSSKMPVVDRFEQIERSTMAAGLYGQGQYLYLLTREPIGDATQWLLHQILPGESKPRSAVRLPTTASFLSIAVGPREWFLVERSKVRGWGKQDIKTLVRVPTAWISSPATSPLNAHDPDVLTCPTVARRGSKPSKPLPPPAL
jgi:hypothetical protein